MLSIASYLHVSGIDPLVYNFYISQYWLCDKNMCCADVGQRRAIL